jgi:hypothetical protein
MKCAMILRGFLRFDVGTQYTLSAGYGLGRRNLQQQGILYLFSKS